MERKMKQFMKKKIILPLIFVGSVLLVIIAVKSKSDIGVQELQYPTKTVEVITAKKLPFRARAIAYGNVEPAILLKARTEISGKISYIHPELKKGAILAKGTVVLRIETTTFDFSLDQSRASLISSKSSLQQLKIEEDSTKRSLDIALKNLVLGQKEQARFLILWEKRLVTRSSMDVEEQKVLQLSQQVETLEGKLASFISRKRATKAQIKKSEIQLSQSKDRLGRTDISLPFDARIGAVSVEKGEFVAVSRLLFEALGTQAVEINAQLPISQFRLLIAGLGKKAMNLQKPEDLKKAFSQMQIGANVSLVSDEHGFAKWQGELIRIGEEINPTRDTINLVVAVNNPYENIIPGRLPPLLKSMYVAVEFYTPPRKMMVLPRKALHQGRVYVVGAKNKLKIRPVNILYKQGELVVIDGGIQEGDRIIITDVIPVIEGLPLNPLQATEYEKKLAKNAIGHFGGDGK
jgi:multidrug efflux pump subunit AcrA (membrane-fusion protein)